MISVYDELYSWSRSAVESVGISSLTMATILLNEKKLIKHKRACKIQVIKSRNNFQFEEGFNQASRNPKSRNKRGDNMKKQMQIRIYSDGKIEAKTLGIKGKQCTDYIQILELLLKARTIESAYTEEYYQTEAQVTVKSVIQQTNN